MFSLLCFGWKAHWRPTSCGKGVSSLNLSERNWHRHPVLVSVRESAEPSGAAIERLESFLAGLKWENSEELIFFFAKNAEFIDASGKRWNREEIWKGFENVFAPYSKKNVTYVVESTLAETRELLVANVLWKNALLVSEPRAWVHRMSFVLLFASGNWEILLAQVTPVQLS
jgi:hypothetical protein